MKTSKLKFIIGNFNKPLSFISIIALIFICVLVSLNVVLRIFSLQIPGVYEISGILCAVSIFLSLGYCEDSEQHVKIDFFEKYIKYNFLYKYYNYVIFITVSSLMMVIFYSFISFGYSKLSHNAATETLHWPYSYWIFISSFGFFGVLLSNVSKLINNNKEII